MGRPALLLHHEKNLVSGRSLAFAFAFGRVAGASGRGERNAAEQRGHRKSGKELKRNLLHDKDS